MVPQSRDPAQLQLEIPRGVQDLVALRVRLEESVLDPVVHHLDVMAGAGRADVRVAVGWREVLENRLAVLDRGRCASDHEAVAERETPYPAARPNVHELDALLLEGLRTTQRVAEVRIPAVDEDVSAREMRNELLDGAFDRSSRHHDPNDSPRGQLLNHVGEVVGGLGAIGDMWFDRVGVRVVHDQLVPALGQSLHHVVTITLNQTGSSPMTLPPSQSLDVIQFKPKILTSTGSSSPTTPRTATGRTGARGSSMSRTSRA